MKCSRWYQVIGFSAAAMLILAAPARGQFTAGHIFVYDNVWQDADVLEYDASGQFVGGTNLPDGWRMSGMGHLRWGPDGTLYQYAELDRPGIGWITGVFEWGPGGQLLDFHDTGDWLNATGFTVLDNGNWFVVGPFGPGGAEAVREYARDFSSFTDFQFAGGGYQGAMMHEGLVYVTGAARVHTFDPLAHSEIGAFDTSADNEDLDVSDDGLIAVNFQWAGGGIDHVEVYNAAGTSVGEALMPDTDLMCRGGVVFGPDGLLYVATAYDLGGSLDTRLASFDPADNYALLDLAGLDNWRGLGSIAIAVPEPATFCVLALGVAGLWRSRRR